MLARTARHAHLFEGTEMPRNYNTLTGAPDSAGPFVSEVNALSGATLTPSPATPLE